MQGPVLWWHDVPVGDAAPDIVRHVPGSSEEYGLRGSVSRFVDLRACAEIGLWCSLPAALSSHPIRRRPPRLHLHVRPTAGGPKLLDADIDALFVRASSVVELGAQIQSISVTPRIAFDFVRNVRSRRPFELLSCSHCFCADVGVSDCISTDRRLCSNCGSNQMTATALVTLLPPWRETEFAHAFVTPHRHLDLDQLDGCTYTIWASTPALIWTAQRPQESGIHVHVERGSNRIIDETFGSVRLNGRQLDRVALLDAMFKNSQA